MTIKTLAKDWYLYVVADGVDKDKLESMNG